MLTGADPAVSVSPLLPDPTSAHARMTLSVALNKARLYYVDYANP
jgi:hypothetical protein